MDDNKKPYRPLLPRLLLALIAVLITIGAIELASRFTPDPDSFSVAENIANLKPNGNPAGYKLRQIAWESSFTERGLNVPPGGPREGLRGEGVTPLNCAVSDCNFRKLVPGIIELNADGLQTIGIEREPLPSHINRRRKRSLGGRRLGYSEYIFLNAV